MRSKSVRLGIAVVVGFSALACNVDLVSGLSFSSAGAVIGRPLTPMSYAGVARRTTRRTVAAGAAYGAAVAAPVVVAPGANCYQVTNSYGQIVTQCQ